MSLWAVPSFVLLRQWQAHERQIYDAAFSPDDLLLATCSVDNTAKIWDAESGKLVREIAGRSGEVLRAISFSHDGTRLAVGTDAMDTSQVWTDRTFEVRVYEVSTGKLLFTTAAGALPISVSAYSPDGRWLAVGRGLTPRYGHNHAGALNVLDAQTGRKVVIDVNDILTPSSIAFSPDSRTMLVAGSFQPVTLWDLETQRQVWRLDDVTANRVVFHPDGQRFVIASPVRVHAAVDGRELVVLEDGALPVTFSADGRRLIHRMRDGRMAICLAEDWTGVAGPEVLQTGLNAVWDALDPVVIPAAGSR